MKEIYKDIKGYEGKYQVSNLGNVRRLQHLITVGNTTRLLKAMDIKTHNVGGGYAGVTICGKSMSVHRLVAEAFIPKTSDDLVVNHKDYNRKNNNANNLEWVTQKENLYHSKEHLLNTKETKTKELNISIRKRRKPYHLSIMRGGKTIQKSFLTIEEAVKERDKIINSIGEAWAL